MYPPLVIRCLAEKQDNLWQVICLDFCLAAQDENLETAKQKLQAQIKDYLHDALEGEDRAFSNELLTRKAPWKYRAKYHITKLLHDCLNVHNGSSEFFNQTLPLRLAA